VVEDGETGRHGVFITLEGPDGSGKSSLLASLGAALRDRGCDVVTTREPGSTPLGEQVRRLVLDTEPRIDRTGRADALLFAASRAQHVDEVIRPGLMRGAVVVCDRYADSSLAYQGAGSGVPMDELRAVQRFATGGLAPDLTVLLDLPVEAGLSRKSAEVTRFEAYHDLAYHERVRAAFLGFAADEPERYAIVDATLDTASVLARALAALGRLAGRMPCLGEPIEPEARMPR
jgi:dTMP kinase